ncbi:MAG TPA: phosphoglycerate dehydrogenase [Chloroflexi bacterium]|nr:phosphoglycerate dehydrogenase [Chloroflexota bacterium]
MMQKSTPPFQIVVADQLHAAGWQILQAAPEVALHGPFNCREDLREVLGSAEALLICAETRVDTAILEAAPRLKVIARAGARLDNVDVDEATRRGILVMHVPEANVTALVEYTFLLMLALARNFKETESSPQAGFQLAGKSLGIVGFGRQGRAVAARAQAFGMRVLAYDPYIDLSFARQQGVEIVDFPELLARADLITLHTAYTQQTRQIINAQALAQMKPGSFLLNCVHPGLVDEAALLEALENGTLAGAAIDIWDPATTSNSRLIQHPKVLSSPQLSQQTREAQVDTATQISRDLLSALRGEDFRNVVNLPFTAQIPYQTVKPYIDLAVKLGKLQGQLAEGWITRVEVELLGEGLRELVRPVAAVLLSGMIKPVDTRPVNWVSAPVMAFEQGVATAQAKELIERRDHPVLIACRVSWEGGSRTVAGALFGNGAARLVQYDDFEVDATPEGYVLILENADVPGVIGKVGTRLGRAGINVAQWRYGREAPGGRAVSFINLDQRVPRDLLAGLEQEAEIRRARLVRL